MTRRRSLPKRAAPSSSGSRSFALSGRMASPARRPGEPLAHGYLALLEGRRGHLDAAEQHLLSFLSVAGEEHEGLRASARKRLAWIEGERRLVGGAGPEALWLSRG